MNLATVIEDSGETCLRLNGSRTCAANNATEASWGWSSSHGASLTHRFRRPSVVGSQKRRYQPPYSLRSVPRCIVGDSSIRTVFPSGGAFLRKPARYTLPIA